MDLSLELLWAFSVTFLAAVFIRERRKNAAKLERIARAEHEIRGPINAACMGLELQLSSGNGSDRRLTAVQSALAGAARALDDLSTARGKETTKSLSSADSQRIDVRALVRDVAEIWVPLAQRLGVELEVEQNRQPIYVVGERIRLQQVCSNLIANALEHGDGPVRVAAKVEDGRCIIEVCDEGNGFTVPMHVLAGAIRPGRGRRGRGLSIANEIAADHGGSIHTAATQSGSRVSVELPLLEAA